MIEDEEKYDRIDQQEVDELMADAIVDQPEPQAQVDANPPGMVEEQQQEEEPQVDAEEEPEAEAEQQPRPE